MNLLNFNGEWPAPSWRRSQLNERMRSVAPDGRPMRTVAGEFIKPNDRLTSFERLEIYNRQYWFRLLSSFAEDFPGFRACCRRPAVQSCPRLT